MFPSIAEDKYIPKLKELTDAIHAEGGKAGIQLWQGGLAVGMDQTAMILLSSDTELAPGFTVPGISKEMIAEVVDCYGKAAASAVAAGFDCIEFHCAHNYLLHSFLSDGLNAAKGTLAAYKYFTIQNHTKLCMTARGTGTMQISLKDECIGTLSFRCEKWTEEALVIPKNCTHAALLLTVTEGSLDILSLSFSPEENP